MLWPCFRPDSRQTRLYFRTSGASVVKNCAVAQTWLVFEFLSVFQVIRVGLLCHDPCNFHLAKACSSALATFLWSGVGWYDRNRMEQVCVFVLDWRVERMPRRFSDGSLNLKEACYKRA